jgi:flagellin
MTVINTNIKALYTQSALKQSERASQAAMEQLSTGKRINSSKDDAAGLAIAARMTQNIKGMNQSIRNSGDAISLIQVVEGATNELTSMLQRMSELAVQSSNSTYSTDQRGYLDQEFQQLKEEIVRISETHEWNGFPILNGKAGTPVGAPITTSTLRAAVDSTGTPKVLNAGDLQIVTADGTSYPIPATSASNDTKSSTVASSSSKAGSAIAIAAAINSVIGTTGVQATANAAQINATKTTVGLTSIQTDLFVNGTKVSLSLTAGQTVGERRQYVIDSINAGTDVHGVTAGDGGNGGLSLKTIDGRNLSVWYDKSAVNGSDFGLGLNTATSSDPAGVTGVASATIAASTGTAAAQTSLVTFPQLAAGQSFTLNGLTYSVAVGGTTVTAANVAAAFASLTSGQTAASVTATNTTAAAAGTFTGTFTSGYTTGSVSATNKVTATSTAKGAIPEIQQSAVGATLVDLATTRAGVSASTVYGTVTLNSINSFTVRPGANAYPSGSSTAADATYANFSALGFKSETINPKNIGRLSFQVGPSPDQLIHIDLADFGKNGDITGAITSDKAPTNILTVQAANDVTQSVNKSLDMIAQTRASMGAVMNRLEHVIDNLTNVVMNSEASRSQIEDADYAKASTELARTQIMQQAATAVLAQANTSQQTVLKLLQG